MTLPRGRRVGLRVAVVLVFRSDAFHASFAPTGRDFVGIVNVEVEHGRHVFFGILVECQMDDDVAPMGEGVGRIVVGWIDGTTSDECDPT